ncbi:putative aldehyde dehydrogenase fus7 [Colletotrichum spaethianum]|uniref:aldehyde dehydrogenase (NAD(+)) n=1 Tax=Colletotrichum spaethianum TaxID=700344 RepID=A0AA37NWZ8_9PEZI|nr:putative aldehyde dehydrogenase fus7 [Colletotrichum spaethianum]GKT41810.1 putative aldehyde dehydrogenase fus7 [Colletotrichum spaethianum]
MGDIANPKAKFTTQHDFVQIINGEPSATQRTRHGINPANLKPKEEVPVASRDDVDRAVAAAQAAFKTWSKFPYDKRRKAVLAYADAIDGLRSQFRDLLISEQGKPADAETDSAISWIRGMANIQLPEDVVEDSETRTIITRYTPLGVVGAIIPWNFPLLLATGKIAPALLTGNVIIVKPSPFTPYCGLKLVELAQQFFPPGVVQSLSGDDDLGPWLTSHPGIDKISFTGSTTTGRLVMQSASKTLKRVTLELGGNDPAIVFPDIDVDKVAEKICLNLKRIYVHERIFEEFKESLVKHVRGYNLGDGSQKGVTHGPLQNSMQYERVKTFFSDIKSQGWKVAVGGEVDTSQGYFITPTIIDRPPEKSRIVVEEPFGPIVPLLSWKDEDEVIDRANDTAMGLGASVWTNDLEKAARVAKQIQAGNVRVNTHFDLSPLAPFAGHKESGIGAEWGANGLKGFCNVQTLFLNKHVVS